MIVPESFVVGGHCDPEATVGVKFAFVEFFSSIHLCSGGSLILVSWDGRSQNSDDIDIISSP
jgi:hypothetical protein